MLSIRSQISLIITKIVRRAIRLVGYHGSSLPGLIMERLSPEFINEVAGKFTGKIVMITGTNGKTTTTSIITALLEQQHKVVVTNQSGSNFTRGIISTLALHSTLNGKLKADFLVLEVDEAYSPKLSAIFKPDVLIGLNVLRDQMDRFGEINKTAQYIADACNQAKQIIINSLDNLLVDVTTKHKHKRLFFTASTDIAQLINNESNLFDSPSGIQLDITNNDATLTSYKYDTKTANAIFSIQSEDKNFINLEWKLIGEHNAFNATAAILAVDLLLPQLNHTDVQNTLTKLRPPYGRGEMLMLNEHQITMSLIKNPSGFNQILHSYDDKSDIGSVAIFVNDEYADSRDVSWIWDTHVAWLQNSKFNIYVGGTRRYDIALCLQYQGVEYRILEGDLIGQQLDHLLNSEKGKVLIMPTYTAMLQLRGIIGKLLGEKHIW